MLNDILAVCVAAAVVAVFATICRADDPYGGAVTGQGYKSLPTLPPSLFMDKFLHQVHLDLLDLEQPLPLVREELVEFPVQLTDF